jgi:hypothetical protein
MKDKNEMEAMLQNGPPKLGLPKEESGELITGVLEKTEETQIPDKPAPEKYDVMKGPPVATTTISVMESIKPVEYSTKGLKADILEFNSSTSMDAMFAGADVLIKSGILPNNITEPSQVIAIVKYGSEMGISSMVALNNIHMIEGKPSLNVHIIGTLLSKNGWDTSTLHDFVQMDNGDYITTIRFTNLNKLKEYRVELEKYANMPPNIQKIYEPILEILRSGFYKDFSFRWSEAVSMGLTNKSNWKKMPSIMMYSRALTIGARRAAPDAMNGVMEIAEMAEISNKELHIDSEGNAEIIN